MIHNTNSKIKFKTSILRSSLCYYSDAYILVGGTIAITGVTADDIARLKRSNKNISILIWKN